MRHGHVQPDDWQGRDRFGFAADHRLPLPKGVSCCSLAGTLAGQRGPLADRLLGDGLVPLNSALGRYDDLTFHLAFPIEGQRIVYRTGHLDLLARPAVVDQLVRWLTSSD